MTCRVSHTSCDCSDAFGLSQSCATVVADRRRADGGGWFVLADPEGNEFYVLRSDSERT